MRAINVLRSLLAAGVVPLAIVSAPTAHAASPILVTCSESALVNAVNTANSAGGGDLVLAPFCTYTLTSAHGSGGAGQPSGLPNITTPITMTGLATQITRAPNALPFRIVEVDGPSHGASGQLTITAVTISGGDAGLASGGGIANLGGAVTLTASAVRGNQAAYGGGIYTEGSLTLVGSGVSGNSAGVDGGGIYTGSGAASLIGSTVTGNTPDDCAATAPAVPAC